TPHPASPHPLSDNVENSCEEESESHVAKLVNGKGPLDNFVQKSKRKEASPSRLFIDLTDDPPHRPNDNTGGTKPNVRVASLGETPKEKGGQAGSPNSSCDTQGDPCLETGLDVTDKELPSTGSAGNETSVCKEDKPPNVIFERKMPVVVLEDILATRSPQAAALERSVTSENETMESCPEEEDTPSTNSSSSSLSLTSSPEATKEHDVTPIAASTPIWKVGIRFRKATSG
ncbi:chromatin assembly factor 1 subunit A-like, partial [Protobothrops mucrosquamatus]|uniref:chromatin assembly factor 1 subunit A-like n=1 Tax=Protobothrops mucrosquamatus TaxID=103944 RepID=UPI0010FAD8FC